ncbi:MAG TPA: two-component regulator propeller domain-containing protein, partial [Pyrinomonadaceae bacterium]|nr:two-component regulator propeller domain-containing protein [Pyrinomonadaceae bacterium]
GRPKFITFRVADTHASNRVNKLIFDAAGDLWCGTDDGIYRAPAESAAAGIPQFKPLPVDVGVAGSSGSGLADNRGHIWFNVGNGLVEVASDQVLRFADEPFRQGAVAMAKDAQGNIFAAADTGIFEFVSPLSANARGGWRKLPLNLNPANGIVTMIHDDEGAFWIGTLHGLVKYRNSQQSLYGVAQGLSDEHVSSLCQDRDGNLWIGTWDGGVCKLAGEMMVSFGKPEGMLSSVHKIIEGQDGHIIACLYPGGLAQFVDGKLVPIPRSQRAPFARIGTRVLQGRDGQWWIATEAEPRGGLFAFRNPHYDWSTASDSLALTRLVGIGSASFMKPEMARSGQGPVVTSIGSILIVGRRHFTNALRWSFLRLSVFSRSRRRRDMVPAF